MRTISIFATLLVAVALGAASVDADKVQLKRAARLATCEKKTRVVNKKLAVLKKKIKDVYRTLSATPTRPCQLNLHPIQPVQLNLQHLQQHLQQQATITHVTLFLLGTTVILRELLPRRFRSVIPVIPFRRLRHLRWHWRQDGRSSLSRFLQGRTSNRNRR